MGEHLLLLRTFFVNMQPSGIYIVSIYMANIAGVVLFLFSLMFCFRKYNPGYMRGFPLYCGVSLVPAIVTLTVPDFQWMAYIIFAVFQLIYFVSFLSQIYSSKVAKWVIWSTTVLFLAYAIVYSFRVSFTENGIKNLTLNAIYFQCFLLVFGSLEYIREIIVKPRIANLSKEPAFWMVISIFFYFAILGPTMFFSMIANSKNMFTLSVIFYSMNNYGQTIGAVLFIIAMTCKRKI